jgi:hypothetical protein
MARIRNIKPEFFDDEGLGALSLGARLCFIGLWTQADRAGRLEDRPVRLKVRLFPFDDAISVETLIDELVGEGCVVRYRVQSKPYLFIPKFSEHQYLSKREPESTIPSIDESDTGTVPVLDKYKVGTTDIGHRTRDNGHRTLASSKPDAGKRPLKPATSNQPIKSLLAEHERLFVARYGDKPGPYGGKHAKLAQSVLAGHSLERATDLLGVFFSDGDPFFASTGHSFAAFVSCLDKVIALAAQGASAYPNDPPPEERLYDCRTCGGFHQGADTSVCSSEKGPVYKCQKCGQPHQGHDETACSKGRSHDAA